MTWKAVAFKVGDTIERHALPLDDVLPHPESRKCWCSPTEQDGVWVHNQSRGKILDAGELERCGKDTARAMRHVDGEGMTSEQRVTDK